MHIVRASPIEIAKQVNIAGYSPRIIVFGGEHRPAEPTKTLFSSLVGSKRLHAVFNPNEVLFISRPESELRDTGFLKIALGDSRLLVNRLANGEIRISGYSNQEHEELANWMAERIEQRKFSPLKTPRLTALWKEITAKYELILPPSEQDFARRVALSLKHKPAATLLVHGYSRKSPNDYTVIFGPEGLAGKVCRAARDLTTPTLYVSPKVIHQANDSKKLGETPRYVKRVELQPIDGIDLEEIGQFFQRHPELGALAKINFR